MLGETSTGKTSLATRFSKKVFHEWQESTIGAAYLTGQVPGLCTFEIWDTAGQERYHSLAPMYYRGAKAAIVVYDITSTASFERAKDWVAQLRKDGPPSIVIALCGNKSDLGSKREVSETEAKALADVSGLLFMETSAKTGFNVEDMFEMVAQALTPSDASTSANGGPDASVSARGIDLTTSVDDEQNIRREGRCC